MIRTTTLGLISLLSALLAVSTLAHAEIVSLNANFSGTQGSSGFFYEWIGDNRATNVQNPSAAGIGSLSYNPSFALPFSPARPTYRYSNSVSFPFVQNYAGNGKDYVVVHPGTGGELFGTGTADIGVSIRYAAPANGFYNFAGAFAPLNNAFDNGNGVDVLVVKGANLDAPIFAATIAPTINIPSDPFLGPASEPFNLGVFLTAGESLRFVVFADGQGQDGTFDGTAFRLGVTPVPEPSSIALALTGIVGLLTLRRRK